MATIPIIVHVTVLWLGNGEQFSILFLLAYLHAEVIPHDSDLGRLPQVDFEFPFKIALGPWPTPPHA